MCVYNLNLNLNAFHRGERVCVLLSCPKSDDYLVNTVVYSYFCILH